MLNFFWTREKRIEVKKQEIYEAVSNRDYKQLKILLSLANINAINCENSDESALDLAVRQDDVISVELLLVHGAIPDYNRPVNVWSESILFQAILNRNYKIIKLLVNYGYDLEKIFEDDTYSNDDNDNILSETISYNSWFKVIEEDDLMTLQFLLECKNREISDDEWCQEMLLAACGLGSSAIAEYLLDRGVSIESMSNIHKWTGVFFAVSCIKLTTFLLLINRDANLKHKDVDGRNILHIAVLYLNRVDLMIALYIMKLLIEKGADVNLADINGLTPINMLFEIDASSIYIPDLFLVQSNIDLVKPDINGITVLHRALFSQYFEAILFNINVDINVKDKMGRTPLHFVNIDCLGTFKVLLEFGADTNVLAYLNDDLLNDATFLNILNQYKLKRNVAKLSDDHNVNALLANRMVQRQIRFSIEECNEFVFELSNEIESMKKTILYGKLTYYDFLRAKKRSCINVAQIPEMYDILIKYYRDHGFVHYENILAKNYLSGFKPLEPIEYQAITSVEENLNTIFNNKLPNLIAYKIKKYIDIEDMVTLENMKLFII